MRKKKSEWPDVVTHIGVITICLAVLWGVVEMELFFIRYGLGFMACLLAGAAIALIGLVCRAIIKEN